MLISSCILLFLEFARIALLETMLIYFILILAWPLSYSSA